MSHAEQQDFIKRTKKRYPAYFTRTSVLEVGSYNVNGTIRFLFENPARYVGLDLAPGKDVDVVCHGADFKSGVMFDVVVSTECFEHDVRWAETFSNMIQLCKSRGLVVFTCAANQRYEHGTRRTTPQDSAVATDYYKNLNVVDFESTFILRDVFLEYLFEARENDLYFHGVKK